MSKAIAFPRVVWPGLLGLVLGAGIIGAEIVGAPGAARAEYVGPNSGAKTVQQIKAQPIDGQTVELRGSLTRKTAPDLFVFKDASGEITVKISPKVVPRAQVRPDTPIELRGQVETGWQNGPRIDAEDVIILPQAK